MPSHPPSPRPTCLRCRRPSTDCFCAGIVPIQTRTRVIILQHPRERDVGIGTARLARLSLAGSVLRSDVDFSADPVVREAIDRANAYVLFPGPEAIDVETARFPEPITLFVLDGTWWQAQKLLKANPALAALPRLRMTPSRPSFYGQIRREPADHCVATIEAIAHVLGHLEGDPSRIATLLGPFVAMVKRQLYFATEVASGRHRRVVVPRPRPDPIPPVLRQGFANIVCIHGEANAWPRLHPERAPPEVVHWLARRLGDAERFETVIAPRGKLAPSTCRHIRLSAEVLGQGESWDGFVQSFTRFVRPDDVLVSWGHFPLSTLAADGLRLANASLDARALAARVLGRRTGTVEDCLAALSIAAPAADGQGRGGHRLAHLDALMRRLCTWPVP